MDWNIHILGDFSQNSSGHPDHSYGGVYKYDDVMQWCRLTLKMQLMQVLHIAEIYKFEYLFWR
jgi:hypothetical protein